MTSLAIFSKSDLAKSKVNTVLATLLAVRFGFHAVILAAVALYLIAALTLPRRGAVKLQPAE
jgi:phage shock protein PspC (stress-responsive transcriptional regulator)